jgi:hypothetical protein
VSSPRQRGASCRAALVARAALSSRMNSVNRLTVRPSWCAAAPGCGAGRNWTSGVELTGTTCLRGGHSPPSGPDDGRRRFST